MTYVQAFRVLPSSSRQIVQRGNLFGDIFHRVATSKRGSSSLSCRKRLDFRSPFSWIGLSCRQGSSTGNSSCMKGDIRILPAQYLRDSDSINYDSATHQRNNVGFDMYTGKVLASTATNDRYRINLVVKQQQQWTIQWADGFASKYSDEWVQDQILSWRHGSPQNVSLPNCTSNRINSAVQPILWDNLSREAVYDTMSLPFHQIVSPSNINNRNSVHVSKETVDSELLRMLYQHGILLVTGTPLHDGGAGVAALAAALSGGTKKDHGISSLLVHYNNKSEANDQNQNTIVLQHGTDGPQRTLYGTVWSTSSHSMPAGSSIADSAYGNGALPLHTDLNYYRDPPGLQIFTMVTPATIKGGESVFTDGFSVAERLRIADSQAFDTLCSVTRRYRCVDEENGWHLEGSGPVISAVDLSKGGNNETRWGPIIGIRHNDLDRLPDRPSSSYAGDEAAIEQFYEQLRHAHFMWDSLLANDDHRLVLSLKEGETVVVVNQRCLHGRYSFTTDSESPRSVMGCYVSQDELNSRFRRAGFRVH